MRKFISIVLTAAIVCATITLPAAADTGKATETVSYTYSYGNADTYTREMEKLNRGLVAIKTTDGVYLSWRLFDSEDAVFGTANKNVSFNVYRDGSKIDTVSDTTNYTDTTVGTTYSVAPVINGIEGDKCEAVTVNSGNYFDIPLEKPAAANLPAYVTENKWHYFTDSTGNKVMQKDDDGNVIVANDWRNDNVAYKSAEYTVGDCSTGDVDGDGDYELIVKWDCDAQDNSYNGVTGNVLLQAYDMEERTGKPLWTIDLGKNIRAGAHYTQFLVYDFDGDGNAEITAKTALGSKDAKGNYVTAASKNSTIAAITSDENETDYRNGDGYILEGNEYFTIFGGKTGEALDTIYYPNQLVAPVIWGDTYGGRCDRFTADVAYLDGETPYAVYMRGYYMRQSGGISERQSACAISFDGSKLSCVHSFDTYDVNSYPYKSASYSYDDNDNYKGVDGYRDGNEIYVGEGNHNCTVADVDNDGKDEVITGALCYELDDNDILGVKWCTFKEHGDALHIGDYDPTHSGLEFFTIHEDGGGTNTKSGTDVTLDFGMSVIDAATGYIMFHSSADSDTGRGIMANVGSGGYYQIIGSSGAGNFQSNGGSKFTAISNGMSNNFRIFWDGDLYDELLDGTSITNWNGLTMSNAFTADGSISINGTKSTPALQADLFGDWREEVVYPTSDNSSLRVFTTTTPTDYKIKTLMHDPVYRSGVAAEQTAYNQPPHVGFYMGEEVFYSPVSYIEIVSLPSKTTYTQGQDLDTTGLVVKAYFEDGTSKNITNYTLSGYDSKEVGEQKITATYSGKTATFTVEVIPISISAINNTYTTTSSSADTIPIGSYTDSFTIEHTVTINSMPADGSTKKESTAGFFMRFSPSDGTGAGWYLTASEPNAAKVIWKSTSTSTITNTPLNIGETYSFKYEFTHVGDGSGAAVNLTITNSDGTIVGQGIGLNLRNLTYDDQKKFFPLGVVQIYNQANTNSTASVTIDKAKLYSSGSIVSVNGAQVKVNVGMLLNTKVYAAAYGDSGILESIEDITPTTVGESTIDVSFSPDKVFMWTSDMYPIDMWDKSAN
ncbi:MAG: bacterial Ig-like domain-containing protein [Hominilimicola sp.]